MFCFDSPPCRRAETVVKYLRFSASHVSNTSRILSVYVPHTHQSFQYFALEGLHACLAPSRSSSTRNVTFLPWCRATIWMVLGRAPAPLHRNEAAALHFSHILPPPLCICHVFATASSSGECEVEVDEPMDHLLIYAGSRSAAIKKQCM